MCVAMESDDETTGDFAVNVNAGRVFKSNTDSGKQVLIVHLFNQATSLYTDGEDISEYLLPELNKLYQSNHGVFSGAHVDYELYKFGSVIRNFVWFKLDSGENIIIFEKRKSFEYFSMKIGKNDETINMALLVLMPEDVVREILSRMSFTYLSALMVECIEMINHPLAIQLGNTLKTYFTNAYKIIEARTGKDYDDYGDG